MIKIENIIRTENIDEKLMLATMFFISTYMYVGVSDFAEAAQNFPEWTALATMVGSFLLLIRNQLPTQISDIVFPEVEIIESDRSAEAVGEEKKEEDQPNSSDELNRPLNDALFTAIAIGGYIIVGYFTNIVLITPIFGFVYTVWFRKPWYTILFVTIISFVIAYMFVTTFQLPIQSGSGL